MMNINTWRDGGLTARTYTYTELHLMRSLSHSVLLAVGFPANFAPPTGLGGCIF